MDILGDSAFLNNTIKTCGKVVRGRKTNETYEIPEAAAIDAVEFLIQRLYPSKRQSSEWGIRSNKGPLKRLD